MNNLEKQQAIKFNRMLEKENSPEYINVPREFRMLKNRRVVQHGQDLAEGKKIGETVTVAGLDKIQLLVTKSAEPLEEINYAE